jgi:hypothetical protein
VNCLAAAGAAHQNGDPGAIEKIPMSGHSIESAFEVDFNVD